MNIPIPSGLKYVCKQCRRQSSVTTGTVLHRTHLSLTVWFWAINLVILHRLRNAMGERDKDYVLSGIIE